MRGEITILLILMALANFLNAQDVQYYYSKGKESYEQKDFLAYYENMKEANKLHPYHQVILYQLGIAAALNNKAEEAIKSLKKAIHIDASFDLETDELKSLQKYSAFLELKQLQKILKTRIESSDTAFVVVDHGSHIESLAYDAKDDAFYFSSIHKRKILKRDNLGNLTDFVESGEHDLTSVFDIQVDEGKNILWACSSPMSEMKNYDSLLHSAVYKFDLTSGKLLNKYETKIPTESVFGDLTLDLNGNVYISDGKSNTIFTVNEKLNQLEPFFTTEEFWNIQGITFSDDGKYLFISDYIKGLYRLDVQSKQIIKIKTELDSSLKGIDGLIFYNNSLIGIQNGTVPNRVVQYKLNKQLNLIINQTIIDNAHRAFDEPTMGCLVGRKLYFVANSMWGAYDESFQIKPELIKDVIILSSRLD